MKTEIGEYIVGAWLKVIKNCDFIIYNVRPPVGGLEGLGELDVVGLNLKNKTVYLCEVTTHITGLLIGDSKKTVQKIEEKHKRQRNYARKYLKAFPRQIFMFWSPVVGSKEILLGINKIKSLEIVVNTKYTKCVEDLKKKARVMSNDIGNPFFRALQILERLKK